MVHLVSVHDAFHARVIAARLGSEGILTELRGALGGPYPLAGEVSVYVARAEAADARELLLADEVEAVFDGGGGDLEADAADPRRSLRAGACVALAALLLSALVAAARSVYGA